MSFLLSPLPPTFEAALRDVHGKKPESRVAAAERLGRADDAERERALTGLRELVGDAHPSVRATAISSIGALEAQDALDVVLAAFDDSAPEVRELAALSAAKIGGQQAIAALREALQSEAPELRFQAVSAVAELAPEHAQHDLLPLLSDADPEVRAQAIGGLSSLDASHLAGHFAGALSDEAIAVRLEAALALAALGDKRAEPVLLQALPTRERLREVTSALAAIGSKAALEPLASMAAGFFTSSYVRATAGAALARLGDERGQRALRRVLTGFDSDARSYAVELVRETQSSALVPELTRLSVRPRGADLLTVVDALATFAPDIEPARRALTQLAARRDDVGERARAALGA